MYIFNRMKRGHFLKSLGGLSLVPFLPALKAQSPPAGSNCVLIPSETPGPFPLDLTENGFFFRQDIREDRPGVQLRQKVRIIGLENCQPMAGVRVNIWHCDRDGNYSGYGTEVGQTYFRGYQFTDDNGECEFITIVPGWYPGRVTHVHFQVFVSTQYSAVSQWTWPHDAVVAAVEAHADLYPEGPDPLAPEQDGIFANGFELQLASLEWDEAAGEYVSEFEATVQGAGTVGVGYLEQRTAAIMTLGKHYPNPCAGWATMPYTLHQPGNVRWAVYDLQGRRVAEVQLGPQPVGDHALRVELAERGLKDASYVFQLTCDTEEGAFHATRRVAQVR